MHADAIVIGGGFAGLSAATAMAEQGARVLVLEARSSLGGRASAFTDPATGERVDNGQHVFFGCYRETFRFLRRVGTADSVRLQQRLALTMIDAEGGVSRLVCPALPAPLHLAAGVLGWNALRWRDRLAVLKLPLREIRNATYKAAATSPPPVTVRQWLVSHGQTGRLIEMLWEPLAVAALNESIDEAAAAPFVRVLAGLFGGEPGDAAVGLSVAPLEELYALPAAEYLRTRGSEVRTNMVVRGCSAIGSGFEVAARDERLRAPRVICAVPWHAIPNLLDNPTPYLSAVAAAARATTARPLVTVNVWFDRPVTPDAFVALPGRAMQWVFDKRALFGARGSHLSMVSSSATALVGRTNGEIVDLALSELRGAIPASAAAQLRRAVVVRERRATFSVAPGQPSRPDVQTDMPGLFLAGDWIDSGLPATIEGAVLTGHKAAAAALAA